MEQIMSDVPNNLLQHLADYFLREIKCRAVYLESGVFDVQVVEGLGLGLLHLFSFGN